MPTTYTLSWDSASQSFQDSGGTPVLRHTSHTNWGPFPATDPSWELDIGHLLDNPNLQVCKATKTHDPHDEDCDERGSEDEAPGSVNEAFKSHFVGTQDSLNNATILRKNDQFIKCIGGRYTWFMYKGADYNLSNSPSIDLQWDPLSTNGSWDVRWFPADCECNTDDEEEENEADPFDPPPAGAMNGRTSIGGEVNSSMDPTNLDLDWSCDITVSATASAAGDPHIKPIYGKPYTI